MDIFDLIGPIMVGPSSSHTAGAVRIGLACRRILGEEVAEADITLSGSFAATGRGHGTDKAIVAGLLGMAPDDVRVPDSFAYAQEKGLLFSFAFGDIPLAHPNTARLVLKGVRGAEADIEAASLGGGRIEIRRLGDMSLRFSAEQPTLIIRNEDRPGNVADVSRILSEGKINIATFQVNRNSLARIRALPGILRAVYVSQE